MSLEKHLIDIKEKLARMETNIEYIKERNIEDRNKVEFLEDKLEKNTKDISKAKGGILFASTLSLLLGIIIGIQRLFQ